MPRYCIVCNNKYAVFNYNDITPQYCGSCKKDDMVDLIHKKCIGDDCKKTPNFNYPNEKKPLYCKTCSLNGMVDVKHKNCIKCNTVRPYFNIENEHIPLYCENCKDDKCCCKKMYKMRIKST
jgi:hypothetical protein